MITGRWGRPAQVLLDITQEPGGRVKGLVNPDGQSAAIRRGAFDESTCDLRLEGEHVRADGVTVPFLISGWLEQRTLRLEYSFGALDGAVDLVRVEEYRPSPLTWRQRWMGVRSDIQRWFRSLSRPTGMANRRRLRQRSESLGSIVCRNAVPEDIDALAELHVTTWNATYNTERGPSIETRRAQWKKVFDRENPLEFILVLESRPGHLVGFAFGSPSFGEFEGVLSKMFLRWEYHGFGLGRRLMEQTARQFMERGMNSFMLFAERSNPSIGFYDRLGGERLLDERGVFMGAYGWRDVRTIAASREQRQIRK